MNTKVNLLKENALEKHYKITISKEEVWNELQSYLQKKSLTQKIQGFRPGKAPLPILYDQHKQEAFNHIVHEHVISLAKDLIGEKELAEPLTYQLQTAVNEMPFDDIKDLSVHIFIAFMPELPVIKWSDFSLKKYVSEPTEDEVSAIITDRAQKTMTSVPLEEKRGAQKGDTLLYNMVYDSPDGNKKETEGAFQLGSGMLPKEFEDALEGVSEGHVFNERLRVPKDFPEKSLAGKKVAFKIVFKEIRKTVPHNADDLFAQSQGCKDLTEYREKVKKDIPLLSAHLTNELEKQQLIQQLHSVLHFDVPDQVIENQWHVLWHTSALRKASDQERKAILAHTSEEEYKKKLREKAIFQVRLQLILKKIIKEQKFSVSDKEFSLRVQNIAETENQSADSIIAFLRRNPQQAQAVADDILEKKALYWACAQCQQEVVTVSMKGMEEKLSEVILGVPAEASKEAEQELDLSKGMENQQEDVLIDASESDEPKDDVGEVQTTADPKSS